MRKTIQEQRQQNLLFGPIFIDADLICLLVSKERSEEHTSELQSQSNLVCRLLLEKKKEYSAYAQSAVAQLAVHLRHSGDQHTSKSAVFLATVLALDPPLVRDSSRDMESEAAPARQ